MVEKELEIIDYYIEEIREAICTEFGVSEITGYCDIASILFQYLLKTFHQMDIKVISGAVETEDDRKGHYWNSYKQYVIDLTADQFGFEYGIMSDELIEEYYVGGKVEDFKYFQEGVDLVIKTYLQHIKIYK